jgi:hypothetical protein
MRPISRRHVLRGAGVALALPWLESLAPRTARAQAAAARRRYVSIFHGNGVVSYYWPAAAGVGDAWSLPSVSEPLAPVKSKLLFLGNVDNVSPYGGHIEPAHGNLGAATWTSTRANGPDNAHSAISIDQVIAKTIGGATPLPSLQVGLSTLDSYPDGLPPQHSRSISWSDAQTPLYKVISPQAVFDRLVGGQPGGSNLSPASDPAAERRRVLRQSTLDYLKDSTAALKLRVGTSDRRRLDSFLSSVRALEQRLAAPGAQTCATMARPSEVYSVGQSAAIAVDDTKYRGDKPASGYDRGAHADLMIDLVVMALQCDQTRVVSIMLDDERSDFVYDFLPIRQFTATSSTPGAGQTVGGFHGLQHAADYSDGFRSVVHWNMQKVARLASKLDAIVEENGRTILDNSVLTVANSMHGDNHDNSDVPVLLLGSGGGVLKQNVYQRWGTSHAHLADVHFTIMKSVFGCPEPSFGTPVGAFTGAGSTILPELLA